MGNIAEKGGNNSEKIYIMFGGISSDRVLRRFEGRGNVPCLLERNTKMLREKND